MQASSPDCRAGLRSQARRGGTAGRLVRELGLVVPWLTVAFVGELETGDSEGSVTAANGEDGGAGRGRRVGAYQSTIYCGQYGTTTLHLDNVREADRS